ncbi:lasso peptide biosynthesis B2 protein [Saccharopolyspora pogona]|uniref:lasso peptide biosynthesis B2 protein n=1 Tax=Saccharopolyspora pogona TaxID=333966 RepID=UPI001CC26F54|nr:lasso peptide biosynthesis B2 protein [Saccharopolyspora pogona]
MAIFAGRFLARLPPHRIRAVLRFLVAGAAPATREQALGARMDVVGTSAYCAGNYCLKRSLAAVLLARLRGAWPTWCVGVRRAPFSAHA